MLVAFRKLTFAALVLDEQARRPGDDADSGYRQIAQEPSYGPQSSCVPRPNCKEQLEIVTAAQRCIQRIAAHPAEPFTRVLPNRE